MPQAAHQPADVVSAQASAGAAAGPTLPALWCQQPWAIGVGLQRGGLNPQGDLLGLSPADNACVAR
jgi:hypothetical protein